MEISYIDAVTVSKILHSQQLTDKQKAEFIKKNSYEIKQIVKSEITQQELAMLMQNRPLIRFRPLKNSFTKRGDKILLAKSLGIETKDVNKYINNLLETNFDTSGSVSAENIDKAKTYVFRHGTKEQVIRFLDYELSDVKFTLERLYKLLDDNSGGLVEYFSRPIHRMDNKTLAKLYNVISKNINDSVKSGCINSEKAASLSEWALVKIYQIQNNSKLIRAVEKYNALT